MSTNASTEIKFHLVVAKRALIKNKGKWEHHEGRDNDLPEKPLNFQPCTGNYKDVAERANQLNHVQERSGYLDYLYSPDPSYAMPVGFSGLTDNGIFE